MKRFLCIVLLTTASFSFVFAQQKGNDVNTALHSSRPEYPVPYGIPKTEDVKNILNKVYQYLDQATPFQFINQHTGEAIHSLNDIDTNTIIKPGDFRLTSYEWGVTYSGMLLAGEVTGDDHFTNYTKDRMNFIGTSIDTFRSLYKKYPTRSNPLRQPIDPKALDDAGAMCAAMIKTFRLSGEKNLRPVIDTYINYISTKEFRLSDGTLARNRPQKNTLWLDDLYMGVPALAQMGKLTGDKKYFDDAVKQIRQFSQRMFNKDLGIYMHGWVESMETHPEFHWARANGWALMTMTELLDVLPTDHEGYDFVMQQFKKHIAGLARYQSGSGFWHQLLDRNDSYLETSATAIYAYCIAHACNKGWVDPATYGPMAMLAWNAVSTRINDKGQVEGTCVGTGMAFDPMFYYYRPVNVFAAHGYGPVLLAGAEILILLKNFSFEMNDSSVQLKEN